MLQRKQEIQNDLGDIQKGEDLISILGYGIGAYRLTLLHLFFIFSVLSIAMLPVMKIYGSHS